MAGTAVPINPMFRIPSFTGLDLRLGTLWAVQNLS